jgi:hypothetical protein
MVAGARWRPVVHPGSFIGTEAPVWDIADKFSDTNLLVTNMAQALTPVSRSLIEVVRM